MKKVLFFVVSLFIFSFQVLQVSASEISFSGGVINQKDEVLFAVDTSVPAQIPYRTLFKKNLNDGQIEQLTFFPEQMELLSGGTVLQIRNRFGTVRYDSVLKQFTTIKAFPAFSSGYAPNHGALEKSAASPDGRWIVTLSPVSPSRGRLILSDASGTNSFELSSSAGRGTLPVSWSPDSSVLIYEDSGSLYYARPDSLFSNSELPANFRIIGEGSVDSVSWYGSSRFLYASGDSVYRVHVPELFTYSLYRPLISVGDLAGKLPAAFNPREDKFCASPDGNSALFVSGSRCIYFFPLYGDDYSAGNGSVPCLLLPGNTAEVFPFWAENGKPAVFARTVDAGESVMKGWILSGTSGSGVFIPVVVPSETKQVVLSPDGNYAAFIGDSGVSVYSVSSWTEVASYVSNAVSAVWIDGNSLYIGGTGTVSRWNFKTGASEIVTISSVNGYGWDEQGVLPVAFVSANPDSSQTSGRFRCTGGMKWELASGSRAGAPVSTNSRYRLYLDSFGGVYKNMLFVRSIHGSGGTSPIVATGNNGAEGVLQESGLKGANPPSVALVFDAVEESDGLPLILSALNDYGIKATFFINGEFIRRHPEAVCDIVEAGHQTASMFFTSWNLSDPGFKIDADFIKRGLARNEDDFHNATGSELSLFWHAPYYVLSPEIAEGGNLAGYEYINADIFVPDWVTAEMSGNLPGLYKGADFIIEDIMRDIKPGDIIPVRIGKNMDGTRSDYLYGRIRVLLNALTEAGYSVVTVNELL